ncbi:DUF4136 domain-containing protein [uncultured Microbulbifer sp.]|uniref:DUF4136 domain-containing protein n=1 Tax=uncultured Microbulbifer sp. TaxID=348147 RepID=UPI002630AC9D|nr:DUF4136 domain-containing protein [uncultured Microbulbifer sp.]
MKQNPRKIVRAISTSTLLAFAVTGAALSGTLSGCATSPADSAAAATLGQYQTFGFAPVTGSNGRAVSLAQNEVSQQLMARGMMPSSNPDLLVNVQVRANPARAYTMPNNSRTVHANVHTEGHLTIDLTDARQKHLVWRGHTDKPITRQVLNNPQRAMDQAVIEAFRSFPLRAR